MAIDPYANCNWSIPVANCTLATCCLVQSNFFYIPSYGGNIFFAIYFAMLLIPQLILGIYYKTWGYLVGLVLGLVLECIGYVARVQIHNSPFAANPFLMYLIALTIAPVFLAAAIYLCITRIIVVHGQNLSRFSPKMIVIFFCTSDFLALLLQAAGGAIADTANTPSSEKVGVDIMIAGLVLQAISLVLFLCLCADFAWSCHIRSLSLAPEKPAIRRRKMFRAFLLGLLIATLAILIRSVFRAAELWGGFNGKLWNNEIDFMVLDGAMIALATTLLTFFHPGLAFHGQWQAANWKFKREKTETEAQVESVEPKQ